MPSSDTPSNVKQASATWPPAFKLRSGHPEDRSQSRINAAAYLDDAIADLMSGQDGLDWFWALPIGPAAVDQLLDRIAAEQVN